MFIERGTCVEITSDINAIPKGRYRVVDTDDWYISFQVGSCIFFSVSHHARKSIRVLETPTRKLTSQKQFLERYYTLLDQIDAQDNAIFEKGKPFTHCMISPSVARETY